jgi:hypothetical protein
MATITELPAGGSDLAAATAADIIAASAAAGVLGTRIDNVRVSCIHATTAGSINVWVESATGGTIKYRLCQQLWLAPMTASQTGDGGQDLGPVCLAPGDRLRAQASAGGLFHVGYAGAVQRGT